MKRVLTAVLAVLAVLLFTACEAATTTTITIPPCDWGFTETVHEEIRIVSVSAPKSTVIGSTVNFADACKPTGVNPLFFKNALVRTHQVLFEFDAIYPLEDIVFTGYAGDDAETVTSVSVDVSRNGYSYTRVIDDRELPDGSGTIDMTGISARYVRVVFAAGLGVTKALQDVRFHLGEGFIVTEAEDWTAALLRYSGWTGADGIFSFNLNGDDAIGAADPITAFVFSDTFVGTVNEAKLTRSSTVMINNSVGYYDGNEDIFEGFTFGYRTESGGAQSAFPPDAYLGFRPNNLLDSDGLSAYLDAAAKLSNAANGVMWRSEKQLENWVEIDFGSIRYLGRLTIWNYNENPLYGVEDVRILVSTDGSAWTTHGEIAVPAASGEDGEEASHTLLFPGTAARYVRLEILTTRHDDVVGLGKLLFEDADGEPLFGQASASGFDPEIAGNEASSRLWLQDGIVLGNSLYLFPLVVKDDASLFKVTRVGLIKAPIAAGRIDFENAVYLSTPLQSKVPGGGVIYYGAGVMDHRDADGYVYVYGYKDRAGRHLVVARVAPEAFEDFNAWRYYDGSGWSQDINDSAPLLEGVSPELSVAKIETGLLAGKYMLVAMEDTTSGRVSYATADTPWGPFSDFTVLFETYESQILMGAFTYNAKMHVHLSEPGKYLISYNVNTSVLQALSDARIYHPRFILVTETKASQ